MSAAREITPFGLQRLAEKAELEAANDMAALPFTSLNTWVDREIPDRHFLVADLIPTGCVTSLYGDGGSGKTLIALWLMVAMASRYSAPWLGLTPQGFRSVGLFAEDDEEELVRRLRRISHAAGVPFASVAEHVTPLAAVGMDATVAYFADTGELVITPLMRGLIAKVQAVGASLLVLDYVAAIYGGNEIDRHQVSEFLRRLNAIARDNDIAILLIGHPSMEGMKSRGTSGSTAWRNQFRSFLHLTVDEDQNDPDGRTLLSLTHAKSNYSRWGDVFKLASDGSRFEVLESVGKEARQPAGPRLTGAQKVCLQALQTAIDQDGETLPTGPNHIDKRCVRIESWRHRAYSMGVSSSDDEASRRRAFYDTRKALQSKGITGEADPWAWVA